MKSILRFVIAVGAVFVLHIVLMSVSEGYFTGWHVAKKYVIALKDYAFTMEYSSLDEALEYVRSSEDAVETLIFDNYAVCINQKGIAACTVVFPTKDKHWKAMPMSSFRSLFRCLGNAKRNNLHILLFECAGKVLVFGEIYSYSPKEIFTDSMARQYPTYVFEQSDSSSQSPCFMHCTFFTLEELEAGYSISVKEDSIVFDGTQWSYDLNGNLI